MDWFECLKVIKARVFKEFNGLIVKEIEMKRLEIDVILFFYSLL